VKPVVDLRLQLQKPSSRRKIALRVMVGKPEPIEPDWFCPIRFGDSKERRIFGVDSWQALILALKYVEANLRYRTRNGAKLYWLGSPISIGRLFANRVGG
jgi:hypothetical protein